MDTSDGDKIMVDGDESRRNGRQDTSQIFGSHHHHFTRHGSHHHRPTRICPSPISSIVGTALNQLNLKRSSSAPMINQLGTGAGADLPLNRNSSVMSQVSTVATRNSSEGTSGNAGMTSATREHADSDPSSVASSFLASLSGPRPRRFSASFSPGSPGPAPNRVSQLRQENSTTTTDWETASEKEFHGTVNMAQSWEDLSLESMSMEVPTRRPSISDQLWLTMPPTSSASASASSSPAASPRVLSRFSPSLSSPSPTRKSFTTRRSQSPIAVRPSVLSISQGVKRKCDWDAGSTPMDCSPQPAKRSGGLLSFHLTPYTVNSTVGGSASQFSGNSPSQLLYNNNTPYHPNLSAASSIVSMIANHVEDSPNSIETESSISSNGGGDSPFFRPVESPLAVTTSPEDSPHPPQTKL